MFVARICCSVIKFGSGIAFSVSMEGLCKAFSKLEITPEMLLEFGKYSIVELEDMTVTWGTTHRGCYFEQIWCEHQSYVKWFLEHYSKSTSLEHQKFLFFIQLKVERLQLETESKNPKKLPSETGVSKTSPAKKTKPQPASQPAPAQPLPLAAKNFWDNGSVAETNGSWEACTQSERSLENRVEDLEAKLEAVGEVLAGGLQINGATSRTEPMVSSP